jgi:phospholipid N-methyltransferase
VSKSSFLKQFFKQNKMVGSMTPSSRFLAAKMLNHIPIKEAKVVVELGPGTGVFTEKIISKLGPNARLLVFELNEQFYEALKVKIKDPRVTLIHDSAEKIEDYLKNNNLLFSDLLNCIQFTFFIIS